MHYHAIRHHKYLRFIIVILLNITHFVKSWESNNNNNNNNNIIVESPCFRHPPSSLNSNNNNNNHYFEKEYLKNYQSSPSTSSFLQTSASSSMYAGPDDDNEAEISALFVKIKTKKGVCQANGTQWLDYHFIKGKFKTALVELGDDTVGIGFFTKNILNLSSPQISNHSKIEVKKRATTRCKSVLMWNFPEVVAPPIVRQRFRIDWAMDMGTVENGTKTYNELVYSTGYHYRLAIKRILVQITLPQKFKKSEIKIFGPDLVNETGGVYDPTTGTVKFERNTYLAPMNRYTVRVWFPTDKDTKGCFACARVGDWIMFLVLAPFIFCFLIPCVLLYLVKDAQRPGTGGGNTVRSTNGGGGPGYQPVATDET